jgi:hypothetical protein
MVATQGVEGSLAAVQSRSKLPPCFAVGGSSNAYIEGQWKLRPQSHPYRLPHALWKHIGLTIGTGSNHHHGLCDDVEPKVWDGLGPRGFGAQGLRHTAHTSISRGINTTYPPSVRPEYYWQPSHCSLEAFDRAPVCEWLGSRSILVVGDSTAFQFFLSLVLLLKASPACHETNARRCAAVLKLVSSSASSTLCDP